VTAAGLSEWQGESGDAATRGIITATRTAMQIVIPT